MAGQTVHECPDSSNCLSFTEAEAEALLRVWKRKERECRGDTLEAAAEILIERSKSRRPSWKRQKKE